MGFVETTKTKHSHHSRGSGDKNTFVIFLRNKPEVVVTGVGRGQCPCFSPRVPQGVSV